ncbi:MAG: hypothetical protein SPL22_12455 [Treponema sp.]|uniref:hypothetical protein n=1 Tax=Treponema sp. TaxID=166 RepID=UPI002A916123|nr:hypothetical protein [Treponema sp.]MDY6398526.1 hypothetical protein [Treponema sp.]
MLVVSYSDFFANPSQYKEKAETFGLKILPKKKEKKISRKLQEKINHLNAVVGLVPPEINVDELLIERRMSK